MGAKNGNICWDLLLSFPMTRQQTFTSPRMGNFSFNFFVGDKGKYQQNRIILMSMSKLLNACYQVVGQNRVMNFTELNRQIEVNMQMLTSAGLGVIESCIFCKFFMCFLPALWIMRTSWVSHSTLQTSHFNGCTWAFHWAWCMIASGAIPFGAFAAAIYGNNIDMKSIARDGIYRA